MQQKNVFQEKRGNEKIYSKEVKNMFEISGNIRFC